MDNVHATLVSANESSIDLGAVDLPKALEVFHDFPWEEEVASAEETGCFPTLSLGAGPRAENGYLNITGCEDGIFMVMVETYRRGTILGFIPRKRTAFRDIEPADKPTAEDCLRKFFELPQQDLFEWIETTGRP